MINVAVVGAGAWGKNLVRNFAETNKARLAYCCDLDEEKLRRIKHRYPDVRVTDSFEEVLGDGSIDAVVIATNAPFHYEMAKQSLLSGKHTYVEKPLTLESRQAEELVRLSEEKNLKLMVGHLMLHHPAVIRLKEIIDSGELGDIYYIYAQRLNLGIVRKDENAWWSLAPHDISMALYLFNDDPVDVSARGECWLQGGIEDTVFANLRFPNRKMAQIHVSWLDPNKVRRLTVVGSKKMVVFDDVEPAEKLRIYDKGADVNLEYHSYGDYITLRSGDILIPRISMTEPLKIECEHFIDCIERDEKPRTDGRDGLRVVRVLEAGSKSLAENGTPIALQ